MCKKSHYFEPQVGVVKADVREVIKTEGVVVFLGASPAYHDLN